MTYLLTGAAGFIGFHVAHKLISDGQKVIGIDNINSYYDPQLKLDRLAELEKLGGDFTFLKLDFTDYDALVSDLADHKFEHIIHLGAQPGVRYSIDNPHAYMQSNLVGYLNMLEIARHRAVAHMVYASSSSVYGSNKKLPYSVDDRVDHPISLYAATKKSNELIGEAYAHLYGIPLTGLRFFTVYGPWGRPDMATWLFAENILKGKPINIYNEGAMQRDFTYVDDIVAGILSCSSSPPKNDGKIKAGGSVSPHAVYNIGNNKPEELGRMIEVMEEACGRKAEKNMMPMQAGDVLSTYADIDAIRQDHGFEPTTSLSEGIPKFVAWYKEYQGL